MIIPPIVGVPCFFKCDAGPSSLSICPTFSFLNIGIVISPNMTDIANDTSNTSISKFNFIKPFVFAYFIYFILYLYILFIFVLFLFSYLSLVSSTLLIYRSLFFAFLLHFFYDFIYNNSFIKWIFYTINFLIWLMSFSC